MASSPLRTSWDDSSICTSEQSINDNDNNSTYTGRWLFDSTSTLQVNQLPSYSRPQDGRYPLGNSASHLGSARSGGGTSRFNTTWLRQKRAVPGSAIEPLPLHQAVALNQIEAVKSIINLGANVNEEDYFTLTPLHYAAKVNAKECAQLLIDNGAYVGARDFFNHTPLHIAARHNAGDVAELLLAKGSDLRCLDKEGRTPFTYVARRNAVAVGRLLLAQGVDVNERDGRGALPIFVAASANAIDVMGMLLEHGVDVNQKNALGKTVLAISSGDMKKLLKEHGAKGRRMTFQTI